MTNRILKRFSEVDHVIGKAGRADTATDPAPLSMLETIIVLKPQSEWRNLSFAIRPSDRHKSMVFSERIKKVGTTAEELLGEIRGLEF